MRRARDAWCAVLDERSLRNNLETMLSAIGCELACDSGKRFRHLSVVNTFRAQPFFEPELLLTACSLDPTGQYLLGCFLPAAPDWVRRESFCPKGPRRLCHQPSGIEEILDSERPRHV